MPRAEELLDRARRAATSGRYPRAERYLDLAAALTTDPDLATQIEITRAYVESETGSPVEGVERCLRALDRQDIGRVTRGRAWQQLGLLRMRSGESEQALRAFGQAVEVLPVEVEDRGYALLNRGDVHLQRHRPDVAVADFAAARDALDRPGLETQRAKAEHNLGYAQLLTGDLVGALRHMEQAAVVLAPASPVNRAVGEQDRAEVLLAAGRPREAIRSLESAVAAYGSRQLRTFQADCELSLAWTVLREDPAKARVIARRAARRYRGQASPVPALRADAAALVAEIATGASSLSLLARADRLAEELREAGHRQDADLLSLQGVRVTLVRGDLDGATSRLRRVRLGEDAPLPTRLLSREVRAELAALRHHRGRARGHVRAGLADLHAWQSSFGSLDLQSTLVAHGRDLALQGLRLALASGSAPLVFEWSERARALVGRVTPVRPPLDPALAADLAELRTLHGAEASSGRRTAQGRRTAELRDRVRQHSWYGEGGGTVGDPVRLDVLQPRLAADDAALVAHLSLDGDLWAVVVTGDEVAVVRLGLTGDLRGRLDAIAADLTMAATHRDGPLAGAVRGSLHGRLRDVSALLVEPVLDQVGDRRVVLTPSGDLAGTPWTLLPGLLGRPLSVAPSATRWLELRRDAEPLTRIGLVAGPRLARAVEEVERSAAPWPGAELLRGERATAEAVTDLAARVDVLHLAGHGTHPGENPLFAAVELADGPWFGYDIDLLRRTPSTVVLSSCDLGRASVRSGEESVGMTAAWLHAGARTVVSAPVLLADDVACEALAQWHALLAQGTPPADALATVAERAADDGDVVPLVCAGAGW